MTLRVMHVITGTDVGGAEMMLVRLLGAATDPSTCEVVSLRPPGPLAARIEALGVRHRSLRLRSVAGLPAAVLRLMAWMRASRADVVQAWMYHANFVGGLAARASGIPVVWDLQATALDPSRDNPQTIRLVRWSAHLSGWLPARIVACAESSRAFHESLGYRPERMVVIPNALDVEDAAHDGEPASAIKSELGVAPEDLVVMGAARYSPMKDHATLVKAAGLLLARMPRVRFVLCGSDVDAGNRELGTAIAATGKPDRFLLLGLRMDVGRLLRAADVFTISSSHGEGMPVAVEEAMASGVPCVVTDVGDCAALVGSTGLVVPRRDPAALAAAWESLLARPAEERKALGAAARERIRQEYSLAKCAGAYAAVHEAVARP